MRRSQIVLLFLSIVIPVSLLATFRLGGVLKEPITIAETTTANAVLWEMERPLGCPINIGDALTSSYNGNGLSVIHIIHILDHDPSSGVWGGRPVTAIRVNVTAEVEEGYVVEVYFEFRGDNYTEVNLPAVEEFAEWLAIEEYEIVVFDNMTLADLADRPSDRLKGDLKCFIRALGVNNPKRVRLSVPIELIEAEMQYQSHQIEGSLEITYFNGSAYKKVVFPSIVRWVADQAGNTLETARTVEFGNYTAYVIHLSDPDDYYKIWIEKGQFIKILLTQQPFLYRDSDYDLYLYDPNGNLAANLTKVGVEETLEIAQIIPETGYWYIRVSIRAGYGYYQLIIKGE